MAGSYWDKIARSGSRAGACCRAPASPGAAAGAVWLVGCGGGSSDNKTPGAAATAPATPAGGSEPCGTPARRRRPAARTTSAAPRDFDTFDPYIGIAASSAYFPALYNVLVNFSALDATFRFDDLLDEARAPGPDDVRLHDPRRREGRPEHSSACRSARSTATDIIEPVTTASRRSRSRTPTASSASGSTRRTASADDKTVHDQDAEAVRVLLQPHRQRDQHDRAEGSADDANVEQAEAAGRRRRPVHAQRAATRRARARRSTGTRTTTARTTNNNNAQLPYIDGYRRQDHHGPATLRDGVPVGPARHVHAAERRRGEPANAGQELHRSTRTPSTRSSPSR